MQQNTAHNTKNNLSIWHTNTAYRTFNGGWFMPCRINVSSGRKRERSPRENPPKWWFCRVFAWRPFASPVKDTTNSSRKRNAWNVAYFRVAGRKHDNTTWHKSATITFSLNCGRKYKLLKHLNATRLCAESRKSKRIFLHELARNGMDISTK